MRHYNRSNERSPNDNQNKYPADRLTLDVLLIKLFTTIQIFFKIVRIPTFKVGPKKKNKYAIKQRRRRLQQITIKFESMLKTNKVLF
jgi:hypothetical protein